MIDYPDQPLSSDYAMMPRHPELLVWGINASVRINMERSGIEEDKENNETTSIISRAFRTKTARTNVNYYSRTT
jgi:hypothetical protein